MDLQRHQQTPILRAIGPAAFLALSVMGTAFIGQVSEASAVVTEAGETTLLKGQRIEPATVVEVLPGQIAVMSDHLRPRYLPKHEDASYTVGDKIEMVINPQNAVVDYFPAMADRPKYQILEGRISVSLEIGHEHAVIDAKDGATRAFRIKPVVRSKIASIPVGVQAVFLVDDGTILDANLADEQAVERAEEQPHAKSPIKGAHRQVAGTLVEPVENDQIRILTRTGNDERAFEVRRHVLKKLTALRGGQAVILLVDRDDKVIDVAIPPETAG